MELKRVPGLDTLMPTTPAGVGKSISVPAGKGPSFQETLSQISGLDKAKSSVVSGNGSELLKFSQHAVERMRSRGISFSPEDLGRIGDAVNRAAAKGSKDSLILMKDSALIVSVKNKTVVTVMDQAALKENVFTNIDSTIVM